MATKDNLVKKAEPIPRIVLGKFLKVVFEEYAGRNLLDSHEFIGELVVPPVADSLFGDEFCILPVDQLTNGSKVARHAAA